MNTNTKLIILAGVAIATLGSLIYLQNIKQNVKKSYSSYEKVANEIAIIKQLKNYYGDKKSNKRKIYTIIDRYKANTLSKNEDKTSLEFTIGKLKDTNLNSLTKDILNSGVKIVKFNIKRVDAHSGELFCKVMF